MHPLPRGPGERLQAWLLTGPLGHLWSAAVDLAAFAGRALGSALARRLEARRGAALEAGRAAKERSR